MRVLLVVNTLPSTDISGVGEQVVQLAAGLEEQGHQVRILGRGPGGSGGPKLLFPVTVIAPFLRISREFRPHVVQVHESDGALVAWLVKTLQATCEPEPVLVALQQVSYLEEFRAVRDLKADDLTVGRPGWEEMCFRWFKAPIQVLFGALTAGLADRLLAPSRQTADEIERDYRVSRVEVLPNVTGARILSRETQAAAGDGETLLFVGRLRIRKGVEILLHAVRDLRNQNPAIQLSIVGDGEHQEHLKSTVMELDLGDCVDFLGSRDPDEIPTLMAGARALVVPSIYEGMPLVILEAMAAGLPVIASRVSGIPEVVTSGETGWLVPPEDIGALAGAIQELLNDPEEGLRRGQRGRRRVESSASPADAARQWMQLVLESSREKGI